MPIIPDFCEALWKQLKAGPVDVHEQELLKARDIKALFELGLIRFTKSAANLQPSRAVVLSEEGRMMVAAELNI